MKLNILFAIPVMLFFMMLHIPATQGQIIKRMDEATWDAINVQVQLAYTQYTLKGISVAVVYGGDIAYANAFGNKNDDGDPFTIHTKSLLASISKTITGTMAMRMVENGDIDLDDALSQYFNYYSGSGMTIRHLLAHQSGIAHYSNCPGGYSGPFNAADSYDIVTDCEICMTPPGSGSLYTTFGNTLLGLLVNDVGLEEYGLGYVGLYNAWIHGPGNLGTLQPAWDSSDPALAEGNVDDSWDDIGWRLPAGGFISDIVDLAHYARGLLDNDFISAATFDQMQVAQTTSGSPDFDCGEASLATWGLSFALSGSDPTEPNFSISHNGGNEHGYSSTFRLYPNRNAAIVMLTNTLNAEAALNAIREGIEDHVLCPTVRNFTNDISWTVPCVFEGDFIYGQSEITSNSGQQFTFDSGEWVLLKPGFHAPAGKRFWAIAFDGCGGSIVTD